MASATDIPAQVLGASDDEVIHESEPLLGRPGDVLQRPGESVFKNLYSGKRLTRLIYPLPLLSAG